MINFLSNASFFGLLCFTLIFHINSVFLALFLSVIHYSVFFHIFGLAVLGCFVSFPFKMLTFL